MKRPFPSLIHTLIRKSPFHLRHTSGIFDTKTPFAYHVVHDIYPPCEHGGWV